MDFVQNYAQDFRSNALIISKLAALNIAQSPDRLKSANEMQVSGRSHAWTVAQYFIRLMLENKNTQLPGSNLTLVHAVCKIRKVNVLSICCSHYAQDCAIQYVL